METDSAREGFQVRDVVDGWELFEAEGAPVEERRRDRRKAAPRA